jgi:hypothetical protein
VAVVEVLPVTTPVVRVDFMEAAEAVVAKRTQPRQPAVTASKD